MSNSSDNSTDYEGSLDSRVGSNDERRESEDEEDIDQEGSSATLGIAPYQFEPIVPASVPANISSLSDGSNEHAQ